MELTTTEDTPTLRWAQACMVPFEDGVDKFTGSVNVTESRKTVLCYGNGEDCQGQHTDTWSLSFPLLQQCMTVYAPETSDCSADMANIIEMKFHIERKVEKRRNLCNITNTKLKDFDTSHVLMTIYGNKTMIKHSSKPFMRIKKRKS